MRNIACVPRLLVGAEQIPEGVDHVLHVGRPVGATRVKGAGGVLEDDRTAAIHTGIAVVEVERRGAEAGVNDHVQLPGT